ncbi:MAG TPA: stage II sporulation protein M [Acidobacteriota bacterium]|nr:stage II sporulation protein M [Acidobacteriota bacterium]HNB72518.1 stage II sporulation protein M [Acidobacteriota bacterium]HND18943.1 stage II sporulation protein M [Acidobacteriota bacterium]
MGRDFIDRRQLNWKRLEEMLSLALRGQLSHLHREQVREFGRLYQRTAADFAIAHQEIRDSHLVNYLNNLVGRAHGTIYRSKSSGFKEIWEFYRYSAPALFRETWRYTLAAFLVFMVVGVFSGVFVFLDDQYSLRLAPEVLDMVKSKQNWTEMINKNNQAASSMIFTNNARVAVYSFATGIFLGLGSLYFMATNGLHIGGVTAMCIKYKFTPILIFMAAHGVFELTAIFIAGGAGFLIGSALLMPGNLRRGEALIERGIKAIKLMMICLPLLVVAGLIEGFLSPLNISPAYKLAVSGATALFLVVYFSTPARRQTQER